MPPPRTPPSPRCSTPHLLTLAQLTVASVLGVGAHKVVVKVKRMGGGFGGKESR